MRFDDVNRFWRYVKIQMKATVEANFLFGVIVCTYWLFIFLVCWVGVLYNNSIGINMGMLIPDRILYDVKVHRKNKYEQEIDMSSYKGHTVDFRFVKLRTILNNCMTFITFDKNLSRD